MQGDFSRPPFVPSDNITRILFQQGRPLVEADLNEAFMAVIEKQNSIWGQLLDMAPVGGGVTLRAPSAVGTGFSVALESGKLVLQPGAMLFPSFQLSLPSKRIIQGFTEFPSLSGRYVSLFSPDTLTYPSFPATRSFVVALVAIERQMLLSELADHRPHITNLRAANFWKIDWQVILVPYEATAGNTLDDVKKGMLSQNRFTPPPPIKVQDFPNKYRGRLMRLELHGFNPTLNEWTFKLGIDNAADCFLASGAGTTLNLTRSGLSKANLPAAAEHLEVERKGQWDWVSGTANELVKVTPSDDGTITVDPSLSTPLDLDAEQKPQHQVRRWVATRSIPIPDPTGGTTVSVELKFDSMVISLSNDDLNKVISNGDYWNFTADGEFVGFRQARYVVPLATILFDGTAPGELRTKAKLAYQFKLPNEILANSEGSPRRPSSTQHQHSIASLVDHARDLLCHKMIGDACSVPVRRWLASMTVGELEGLSKNDLRRRILRDCGEQSGDSDQFESDLDLVIAQREHFTNLHSAYA